MKRIGCTAIPVNYIMTPYHPLFHLYPEEVYMFFGAYGASLDMFAATSYNRDLWPQWYLAKNLERLQLMGEAAERHGLTGLLILCEPRMQHPGIFDRHPSWRGPRVDNPNISTTPVYSLNTDIPEVQDHYCRMLRTVLDAAPGIRDIVFFSQDSGAGFSFAEHLYSGPHGGRLYAKKPLVQRVIDFCSVLRDEGRKTQPKFEVSLTTSFSMAERRGIHADDSEGIHLAVHGAESWCGGLEDQWAYAQCGAQRLEEIGFEAAREERVAKFGQTMELARQHGRRPRCMSEAPNDLFFELKVVPNPWEQLEILERYEQWDADSLFLRGYLTSDEENPYDINQEALRRFLSDRDCSATQAVHDSLAAWVREPVIAPLEEALRAVETAVRNRPHYRNFIEREMPLFPGPLVPDPTALTQEEKSYYWTVGHETLQRLHGPMHWVPRLDKPSAGYVLRQFNASTFPSLKISYAAFQDAREKAAGDENSIACIDEIEQYTRMYECLQRTAFHLAQMVVHWLRIEGVDVPDPPAIVEAEIENTEQWRTGLGDNPDKWVRLAPYPGIMYSAHKGLPGHLEERIRLMRRHRGDPMRCM
jgi:hypothetical protein